MTDTRLTYGEFLAVATSLKTVTGVSNKTLEKGINKHGVLARIFRKIKDDPRAIHTFVSRSLHRDTLDYCKANDVQVDTQNYHELLSSGGDSPRIEYTGQKKLRFVGLYFGDQEARVLLPVLEDRTLNTILPPKQQSYDFVDPQHYKDGGMEAIDMMRRIWGDEKVLAYCEMNAFKYRVRVGKKPGADIQTDLAKARWYEDKAIELRKLL